jgi:pantoate--beta-alanine ligase
VFVPDFVQMYPDDYRYKVTEREQSLVLEGEHRPGHFDGVLTVVLRLLLLVRAQVAYFGEKDWQQLRLVEGMVEAFFLDTEIRRVATMRETDGLAMSSRNVRRGREARTVAPLFYRALTESADCETARRMLETAGFLVEYIEEWEGRRLGAVILDGVRLIDNVAVGEEIQG